MPAIRKKVAPAADKAPSRPNRSAKGAGQSQQDRPVVTSAIIALVFLVIAVAGLSVRATSMKSKSVEAVTGTLNTVYQRQATFHLLNQRFASWIELENLGMRLPVDQTVVQTHTMTSHWFLSLRHTKTGVICSKTGELFDQSASDHRPVCRDPGK
jgi:hypothetical protein